MLDAQSWALDLRGVFRGFDLEFDARYAELLFAIFEQEISRRAVVTDSDLAIYGRRNKRMYSLYRRAGPVNWTPRFDAVFLDGAGFKSFLRYVENNPVRAHMTKKATDW